MLGNFCTSWAPLQKFPNVEKDFKDFGATISRYFAIVLENVLRMTIDLIAPDD
ncbi:hypothetical protein Gotri_022848, partial [Gossypium trilobum]|nr:hypothetical protein [Gossypium trilobum]